MTDISGSFSEKQTAAILGDVFRERRTGVLHLRKEEGGETWSFVSGDLYLPPDHRLVETFRKQRDQITGDAGFSWIELALAMLERWQGGEYEFVMGAGEISADLYGPLPTAALVMHASVSGLQEFDLSRLLGGDDQLLVTGGLQVEGLGTELDPHEAFFLSRLEQPVAVRDLLQLSEINREAALTKLCRLLAVDLIRAQEEEKRPKAESPLLSPKLLANFSKRIGESLEEKPIQAEPEPHRAKVAGLLSRLGGMTFYELLGIGVGAGAEEIHEAYTRLARVVHPLHAKPLGFEGKEAGLQLLFEKATEAYLTLSDAERSRRYLQEVGTDAVTVERQTGEERQEELNELAERHYHQAKAYEARGDYHFAVELLLQAVRVSPRSEYLALLGRCQARNPQWIAKAVASFERAVELEPENPDLRIEMGETLELQGRAARAREEYDRALEILPGHPGAIAALERQKQSKDPKKKKKKKGGKAESVAQEGGAPAKKGFFARLFRR